MPRPERRLVVSVAEIGTLAELLAREGIEPGAIHAGRLFLNRQRVSDPSQRLHEGDEVVLYGDRSSEHGPSIRIVERRGDLVVIDKPSGIASEPTRQWLGLSAKEQLEQTLRTTVHLCSRLDVGVSGLLLASLGSEAHRLVEQQRERGRLRKHYLAIASGTPQPEAGDWTRPLPARARAKRATQPAHTRYRTLATTGRRECVLRLEPLTGRRHQLRFHAATAGVALLGDKRYSGPPRIARGDGGVVQLRRILLHAAGLELNDSAGKPWHVESTPPPEFFQVWELLGGDSGCLFDTPH